MIMGNPGCLGKEQRNVTLLISLTPGRREYSLIKPWYVPERVKCRFRLVSRMKIILFSTKKSG